jgi:hypothetical protein
VIQFGRRCAMGCETWPDDDEYAICPTCRSETKRYKGVKPLSKKEARTLKRQAEFESYYATQHEPDLTPLTDEDCAALGITIVHPA